MKKDKLHIHWYPGHIAKAEKKLKEKIGLCDVVIEIIDSRIPKSSSYGDIERLIGEKPRLILFNKSDLADFAEEKLWKERFEKDSKCPVILTTSKDSKDNAKIIKKILDLSKEKMEALQAKGLLKRATRVMVVGMPNVGKSSIINKLTKSGKTKAGAKAGVTRQQQWVRINPEIDLLDTPGIIPMKQEDQERAIKLAFVNSVSENAYSAEMVCIELLKILDKKYSETVKEYYKLQDDISLESIAIARNWIVQGGNPDIERTANFVLRDFREGKIGKFILDELI